MNGRIVGLVAMLVAFAVTANAESGSYFVSGQSALELNPSSGLVSGTALSTEPFYLVPGVEYQVCVSGDATYLDSALPATEVLFFYSETTLDGERIRMRSIATGECFTFTANAAVPAGEPRLWMFLVDQLSADNQGGFTVTVGPSSVSTRSASWGEVKVLYSAEGQK